LFFREVHGAEKGSLQARGRFAGFRRTLLFRLPRDITLAGFRARRTRFRTILRALLRALFGTLLWTLFGTLL
jgi:hypothetical protein